MPVILVHLRSTGAWARTLIFIYIGLVCAIVMLILGIISGDVGAVLFGVIAGGGLGGYVWLYHKRHGTFMD